MAMISDHWSSLYDARVNEAFYIGFDQGGRRQSMIPRLFNVQSTNMADYRSQAIGGVPATGWNFEDSGRVQYTEPELGYQEVFTPHEFARGVIIERKLIDDAKISQALDMVTALGDSAFRVRENAAANVFINAFSAATSETLDDYGTDATGSDSVALCSTAHPRSPQETGTTDTNEGTTALTAAGLSTVRQAHMALVDMNGDLLNIMPDELLVPPELEDTALQIVRSSLDPASANNTFNPQNTGRWNVIVWHQLTDANAWFMIDSGLRRQHLRWFDRIPLEFGREQDFDTFAVKYRAYMRWTLGWNEWRWIYGENPS